MCQKDSKESWEGLYVNLYSIRLMQWNVLRLTQEYK